MPFQNMNNNHDCKTTSEHLFPKFSHWNYKLDDILLFFFFRWITCVRKSIFMAVPSDSGWYTCSGIYTTVPFSDKIIWQIPGNVSIQFLCEVCFLEINSINICSGNHSLSLKINFLIALETSRISYAFYLEVQW